MCLVVFMMFAKCSGLIVKISLEQEGFCQWSIIKWISSRHIFPIQNITIDGMNQNHFNCEQLLIIEMLGQTMNYRRIKPFSFNFLLVSGFKRWICHLSFHMHYSPLSHECWTNQKTKSECIFCLQILGNCKSQFALMLLNVHCPVELSIGHHNTMRWHFFYS